tara:strand:+ start:1900 stop:3285 length:1386 start_codon:yes stop_codon:yes gene_type:complete
MDASVFSFRNNSNEVQEFSVFESSSLSGANSNLSVVWNFESNYSPIYNIPDTRWWNPKVTNSPGAFAIRLFRTDGSTFVESTAGNNDPALTNLTTAEFQDYLNNGPFGDIGVWEFIGPSAVNEELGAIISFWTIRCTPTQAFIDANNISTSPSLNYGVESISLGGQNAAFNWTNIVVKPRSSAVAPALASNPNISVVSNSNFSYSDFLWSTIQRTYDIKNFQIFSLSQQQILQPFLFDRTLATGKVYQKVLTPTIDPYQSQNYIITPDGKGYVLDGFTKIKYTLLPLTTVRLILDYTYIDISTPLIASLVKPEIIKDYITPDFVDNMETGYDKFGCDFLIKRSEELSQKLQWLKDGKPLQPQFSNQSGSSVSAISASTTGKNPLWQEQITSRLLYIKQLMTNYDCFSKEEIDAMPQFGGVGSEFVRNNLWMPSPEFVQHQLDTEQGARKLFRKHDFPIEKE